MFAALNKDKKQLVRYIKQTLYHLQQQFIFAQKHLQQQHPKRRLAEQAQQLDFYEATLIRLQQKILTDYQTKLHILAAKLDALSPLATLQRGFSITSRIKDQKILHDSSQVSIGDKIHIRLMQGQLECTVDDNT